MSRGKTKELYVPIDTFEGLWSNVWDVLRHGSDKGVFMDVYTKWAGSCTAVAPLVRKWASDHDQLDETTCTIKFLLVDADKVAATYNPSFLKNATYNQEAEVEYLRILLDFAKGRSRPTFVVYVNNGCASRLKSAPFVAGTGDGAAHALSPGSAALVLIDGIDMSSINLCLDAMKPKSAEERDKEAEEQKNMENNHPSTLGVDGTKSAPSSATPTPRITSGGSFGGAAEDSTIATSKFYTAYPTRTAPLALAAASYKPPQNVQKDYRFRSLLTEHGWTAVYEQEYAVPMSTEEVLGGIKKSSGKDSWLCIGALDLEGDPDVFVLAAFIKAKDFLASFSDEKNLARGPYNGKIFAYVRAGCSMGFVQGTPEILLNPEDKAKKNPGTRLSWVLDASGGARLGEKCMLQESTRFLKVILQTPY
eukprot:ANDGO_03471.mRNA.1 hypothetical protein